MRFRRNSTLTLILMAWLASGCALLDEGGQKKTPAMGFITTPVSYYSTPKARYLGTKYRDNLERLATRIVRDPKTSPLQFANNISSVGGIGFFTHSAAKTPDERYLEVVLATPESFDKKGDYSERVAELFARYGSALLSILSGDREIHQEADLSGYGLNLAWRNVISQGSSSRVAMARAVIYFQKERVTSFLRQELNANDLLAKAVIFAVEDDGPLQLVSYEPRPTAPDYRPAIREVNLAASPPVAKTAPARDAAERVTEINAKSEKNTETAKREPAALGGQKQSERAAAPTAAEAKAAAETLPAPHKDRPAIQPAAVEVSRKPEAVPAPKPEKTAALPRPEPAALAEKKPIERAATPKVAEPKAEAVTKPAVAQDRPVVSPPAVVVSRKPEPVPASSRSDAQPEKLGLRTEDRPVSVTPAPAKARPEPPQTASSGGEKQAIEQTRPDLAGTVAASKPPLTPRQSTPRDREGQAGSQETLAKAPVLEAPKSPPAVKPVAEPVKQPVPAVTVKDEAPKEAPRLEPRELPKPATSIKPTAPSRAEKAEIGSDAVAKLEKRAVTPAAPAPATPGTLTQPPVIPEKVPPVPATQERRPPEEERKTEITGGAEKSTAPPSTKANVPPTMRETFRVPAGDKKGEVATVARAPEPAPPSGTALPPPPVTIARSTVPPLPAARPEPARQVREKPVDKPAPEQLASIKKPVEVAVEKKPLGQFAPKPLEGFVIQIAFNDKEKAQSWAEKMTQRGYAVSVTAAGAGDDRSLRVRLGNFAQRDDAERQLKNLKQDGMNGIIINLPQAFRPAARSSMP